MAPSQLSDLAVTTSSAQLFSGSISLKETGESISEVIAELPNLAQEETKAALRFAEKQQTKRNWILALVLLLVYVTLAVTSSQLTNIVLKDNNFKAPFLFTLIKMACRIIMFPLYLLINTLVKIARGKKVNLGRTMRRCESVFGKHGLTIRNVLTKLLPAAVTMLIHQITYTFGLANLSTSIATALYALAVAVSYILSWLILKHPLLIIKSIFVLISMCGVGLIAFASFASEDTSNDAVFGVTSIIISVFFLSFHQLSFKKAFPKGDLGQVSFALAGVFFLICFIFWPVPVILNIVGLESYNISDMPYAINIPTWFMSAVSSTVYGYGLVLSSPYFMSVGELLILAANSGIDVLLRGVIIEPEQIFGTVLVAIAFVVMIMPDHFLSLNLRKRNHILEKTLQNDLHGVPAAKAEQTMEPSESTGTLEFIQATVPDAIQVHGDISGEEPRVPPDFTEAEQQAAIEEQRF